VGPPRRRSTRAAVPTSVLDVSGLPRSWPSRQGRLCP